MCVCVCVCVLDVHECIYVHVGGCTGCTQKECNSRVPDQNSVSQA